MALLDTDYRTLESEYESLLAPKQARPKAVLFGDSMSEYVGYNADGTPNTKYGNSIADVIGNNLGISVENLATGGETSNEALAGGSKFGAFADYIAQNRPEYAIIRYGAADAIKNQDPNITLQSVQQMVDIARANGVTPIIVGVSELYGAQNSKTGNIAGYIDPGAEQRANAINAGLAQIAANNGLAFTDVRSAVSAGKGDLLDGVHTNADFGKKMADAISESIVEQGAIQGANVPQLPPNVDALSNEEKGRLYNQFIEQGFSDAQIRTAAKAESDQDWNALKQIAASVKNTTPATIERRAALEAAPTVSTSDVVSQGLLGTQTKLVPDDVKSQLDAFGPYDPNSEVWYYGGPQIVSGGKIYRKDPSGNIDITVAGGGPGSLQQVVSPTGELLLSTTDTGETSRLMGFMQTALPAVAASALLGPAGTGLFSAPTAAAIGSGGTTLARGGSVEDALKSAALAGITAYGLDYLTASPELLEARQLASSGMSEEAIVDTLISRGVSTNAAIEAASNATGLPAAGANRGLEFASTRAVPDVIVTGSSAVAPGITAAAPAIAAIPVASQGLLTTGPVQQTQIEASRVDPDTASMILSGALGQPVSVAGSTQQVQVTGETPRQISQNEAAAALSSLTGQQVQVTGQTVTNQQVADTLPAAAAALPQTVPVTVQTLPTTQPETMAPAATAGLLTTAPTQQQQVQVTSPQLDPDAASNILSSVLGQPISVAGSTQQVTVTGETPRQISPDTAAAVLSSLVGQQVQVTGQTVTSQQAAETLPAAASTLLQSVPVTGQNIPATQPETVAPAVTAGLLAQTQTVPVTTQNVPTTAADVAPAAVAGLLTPPVQTVPVTGQNLPATQDVAGPTGAMLGTAIAPTQTVPVETRTIQTQTTAPVIPVTPTQSVSVAGNREVPTATAVIPTTAAGVTAPAQPTTITARDAALAGLLLAGAGSLGGGDGGQPGGTVSGPISGVIPTYPGRGSYQMPSLFQIAPTNVYNPFATVAPFGAGRFGAVNQPITLPYGLLAGPIGVTAGINAPTRGLI